MRPRAVEPASGLSSSDPSWVQAHLETTFYPFSLFSCFVDSFPFLQPSLSPSHFAVYTKDILIPWKG